MAKNINVKEYFDVSAYRNTLDMINTFEGVLNRWGKDLHNEAVTFIFYSRYTWFKVRNYSDEQNPARYTIARNPGIVGYAVSKIGNKGIYDTPRIYLEKVMKTNGLLKPYFSVQPANNINMVNGAYNKSILSVGSFSVSDLLQLSRNLNWELNRLRLPVPFNFRQINEKIQGKDYSALTMIKLGNRSGINKVASQAYINLTQLMSVYTQLKKAIKALRISVRKEIDAANLAKKVQEETLRREQAELITREKAKAEAEQKRIQILAEKKAAYEKEFLEAEKLKKELAQTRSELQAELENLRKLKTVATEPEKIEIATKEKEIINTVEKVDSIKDDKILATETAKAAVINLNDEIKEAVIEAKQIQTKTGIIKPQKKNLTPLLLTVAAGVFLS